MYETRSGLRQTSSTAECCSGTEEDSKSVKCTRFHKSSPHLRKRKSEPLLPSPPRNETRSTQSGVHILPSRSTTDHIG